MQEKDSMRTREQERASFAWKKVSKLGGELLSKYKDTARKFPSMVVNNGLGQTLAFLIAKGTEKGEPDEKKSEWQLYAHIQEWLCQTEICKVTDDEKSGTEFKLIVWLTDSRTKSIHYRRATLEALSLASWLKRFSEALAPD